MSAPVTAPAFAHLLPADVITRVEAQRALAADLGREHASHVARIAEIDARLDAWSARIDALCAQWEATHA